MAELGRLHGVTKRQVQAAYAKHREQVVAEHAKRIESKLMARLTARDTMSRAEKQQRDEQLNAKIQTRAALDAALRVTRKLAAHGKALAPKRRKKPTK